jgi:hypothetical protein
VVVVDNDMLDPDWSHTECVVLDSLLALTVADHIGHSPFELAEVCHKDADQDDDLVEILDASSLVQRDLGLGLGSPNVVVIEHVEDMPAQG